MTIEFKWNAHDDPFIDNSVADGKTTFVRDTNRAMDTLGQITGYAAAQLGSQFRCHLYSVLVIRDRARLLRWDRTGTIVSESFEYNEDNHLADFFTRYSCASPEMRGHDASVSQPNHTESEAAAKTLGLPCTTEFVQLEVPEGAGIRTFVVPVPVAPAYTPPGRATRAFKAYDVSSRKIVFLKDTWRIDLPEIYPEGRTYRILKEASVRNIPSCLAAGDIRGDDYHATKTHIYSNRSWACSDHVHFTPHRHYRLALDVFGLPLTEFQSSHQLVSAIRDSLIGKSTFTSEHFLS